MTEHMKLTEMTDGELLGKIEWNYQQGYKEWVMIYELEYIRRHLK